MEKWKNSWIDWQKGEWVDRQMGKWMNDKEMEVWMDRQSGRRMVSETNGWLDGWIG